MSAPPSTVAGIGDVARDLGLAPRDALLLALRRARRPDAEWSALLADARLLSRSSVIDLLATPVDDYAQGEIDRALALLFARAGT